MTHTDISDAIKETFTEARRLRQKGFSINEIASRLGLPPVLVRLWFGRVSIRSKRKPA